MNNKLKLKTKLSYPEPSQIRFLRKCGFTIRTKFDEGQFENLKKKLLNFAGVAVTFSSTCDEDLGNIMKRGKLWRGYKSIGAKGKPSHCHSNSCELYLLNPKTVRICTGYAMSDDSIWRQHSWAIDIGLNRPIETTEKRVLYFGYKMNKQECNQFCFDNAVY